MNIISERLLICICTNKTQQEENHKYSFNKNGEMPAVLEATTLLEVLE